jgi:hypothetical protein
MCESGACSYESSIEIPNDTFSLSGKWKQLQESIELISDSGSLFYHFNAGKVHIVADSVNPVTAEIFIDGKPIASNISGGSVVSGQVTFSESKLYTLVDIKGKSETHMLEIRFKDSGFRGYAFTFGS